MLLQISFCLSCDEIAAKWLRAQRYKPIELKGDQWRVIFYNQYWQLMLPLVITCPSNTGTTVVEEALTSMTRAVGRPEANVAKTGDFPKYTAGTLNVSKAFDVSC